MHDVPNGGAVMARSRNVKPAFFENETLADCTAHERLLFIGLWTLADRRGILADRPRRIKAAIFPYEDVDCEPMLRTLQSAGFISRYAVGDDACILIPAFAKHQNPHVNEQANTLPGPHEHQTSTVHAPESHRTAPEESLLPLTESGIPHAASPTPARAGNGAAAGGSYCSIIGDETYKAVAGQFRRIDPSLVPGWFGGMLAKAQSQCGPADRPQLEEAVKVTLSELERRLSAERNGSGGTPVVSVKRFAEAVFLRNLADALDMRP